MSSYSYLTQKAINSITLSLVGVNWSNLFTTLRMMPARGKRIRT